MDPYRPYITEHTDDSTGHLNDQPMNQVDTSNIVDIMTYFSPVRTNVDFVSLPATTLSDIGSGQEPNPIPHPFRLPLTHWTYFIYFVANYDCPHDDDIIERYTSCSSADNLVTKSKISLSTLWKDVYEPITGPHMLPQPYWCQAVCLPWVLWIGKLVSAMRPPPPLTW
ncbi:hypothetical protein CPB86DRAFT_779400 [Serendipita vermifera]|nr:hypothetical protein CPB86DRAFT_779400 [Serendipita vermifera]